MSLAGSYLSSSDMQALARIFAGAEAGPLPLEETLRSASREASSVPLQAGLDSLAQLVERGVPLEAALSALNTRLTPRHQAVLTAAVKSGDTPLFLTQWRLQEAHRTRTWQRIKSALSYPALLYLLAAILLPAGALFVLAPIRETITDFGLETFPWILRNTWIAWIPLGTIILAIVVAMVSRFARHHGGTGIETHLPLVGQLVRLDASIQWLRMLQLLVSRQLPLPEAVRLATAACDEPALRWYAEKKVVPSINLGESLSQACLRSEILPVSCVPWLERGEQQNQLAPSLGLAAGLLERRLERRVALVTTILPFLISGLAVFAALTLMGSITVAFVPLLRSLSSFGPGAPTEAKVSIEPIALGIIPGLAILIARQLIFGRSGKRTYSWVIISILGHSLLFTGALSLAFLAGGMLLGSVFLIASIYFWEMYLIGIRQEADDTLIDAVGLALQNEISPVSMSLAVAVQSTGWATLRAERLARALEAGAPLDFAVLQARVWLTPTQRVAIQVGTELGLAGKFLDADFQAKVAPGRKPQEMFGNVTYLAMLALATFLIVTFVMLKIVPVFDKMFQEFGLKLPLLTLSLVSLSQACVHYWFVWAPLFMFVVFPLSIIAHSVSLGWTPARFPLLSRWIGPVDAALVLRTLGQGIAAGLNPLRVLESLAKNYPKPYMARRLKATLAQAMQGVDLVEALRGNRIISQGMGGLLTAATRSKHLSWALLEVADGLLRRQQLRWQVFLQLVNPLVTILFGTFVGYVVIALFVPLIALIQGLSGGGQR